MDKNTFCSKLSTKLGEAYHIVDKNKLDNNNGGSVVTTRICHDSGVSVLADLHLVLNWHAR